MGQHLSEICTPKEQKDVEDVPSHPGASRVPYMRMQLYYASVCKLVRAGDEMGTAWLTTLSEFHPSLTKGLADPEQQVIVCPKTCAPTKALAGQCTPIFDFVDEGVQGTAVSLQPDIFYYSKADGNYAVVAIEKQDPKLRSPLKLGTMLTPRDLPGGATVTVVAHPRGRAREVSIGHLTHADAAGVYYNAGAKAAVGSAVLFAHDNHLHVLAMGLKSVGEKGREENMGVSVTAMAAEMRQPAQAPLPPVAPTLLATPTPNSPNPMETQSPMASGMEMSKVIDAVNQAVKLPNGHSCTYTGKLKTPQNLPHGEGKAVYDHGVEYEGTWKNGNRDGKGTIIRESEGYKSEGECKDDLFIGTWTKYNLKDGSVMDETHYDHSPLDSWKRSLGSAFGYKGTAEAKK
jgi:hypothetical protein